MVIAAPLPRTVVVIHRTGIGDLIWHIPYLRAIAAASADGAVSLIARPSCRAADVLAAERCIAEVIEFDRKPRKGEGRSGRHDPLGAQLRFARGLRERGFERIYILSGRIRYAALALLGREPLAVVHMASLNPSRRFGLEQEIGSIRYGKRADFLVVDRAYGLQAVWKDGRPVIQK